MHTRVRNTPSLTLTEAVVRTATQELIDNARARRLDRIEAMQLPDIALLAHLQHHGAATPLLDVTVDPLVALWMFAHAPNDPTSGDELNGAVFAIRRPAQKQGRWLASLDSRPYWRPGVPTIADAVSTSVHWYGAPDISERLRIQPGSFLIGPVAGAGQVTFPLTWEATEGGVGWLGRRIGQLGQKGGRREVAATDIVRFRVAAASQAGTQEMARSTGRADANGHLSNALA